MAARREIRTVLPLFLLQLDVPVLLLRGHRLQQRAQSVSRRVLRAQRDEDERHAHVAEFGEGHRVLVLVPLETRRPVERELRLWETLVDLARELLHRPTVRGWEFAPQ